MIPLSGRASRFLRGNPYSHLAVVVFLLVCALLTATRTSAQSNAVTLPRNLAELVGESQTVVQGQITAVTLEKHAQLRNLMTVVVTLRVEDTLKGDTGKTHTFRQAVIDPRDAQQKMGYRMGQQVLLILMKPSPFGLTSPAGMQQGWFHIKSGSDGKRIAENGLSNAGLFRGLNAQLRAKGLHVTPEVLAMIAKAGAGPVSLEHLKSLVRTIATAESLQ